jgi:calcineurin-like phosphoesterase family protein
MKKIWVVADLHWGHDGLVTDGFRPADYGERLLANIGRYVNHDDILICLGDVCWKDYDLWHERLCFIPCKRWLVRGNHDSAKSLGWLTDHGWDMVCDSFRLEIFGKKILFSHYPMAGDFDLNIHGHFITLDWIRLRKRSLSYLRSLLLSISWLRWSI